METKNEKVFIVIAGIIIGAIASLLVYFGNPANMGFCIACFIRDTAGGLGVHMVLYSEVSLSLLLKRNLRQKEEAHLLQDLCSDFL